MTALDVYKYKVKTKGHGDTAHLRYEYAYEISLGAFICNFNDTAVVYMFKTEEHALMFALKYG